MVREGDPLDIGQTVSEELKRYGIIAISKTGAFPLDFISCQALYCELDYSPHETISQIVKLKFRDCNNNIISESQSGCAVCGYTVEAELRQAAIKAVRKIKSIDSYKYDQEILSHTLPALELTEENENTLMDYFKSNSLDNLEGIYKSIEENGNSYTIGIKKFDHLYKGIIINADYKYWRVGEVKILLNPTATKNLYSCDYFMANKTKKQIFLAIENPGLLSFRINEVNTSNYIKMFPSLSDQNDNELEGEWRGNGSGFFISRDGFIATNNHVVNDAEKIDIEFHYFNKLQRLNALVVQRDIINDLAVLMIDDTAFTELDALPFNFQDQTIDVGTEVFALGYPMALSIMGKEIKYTKGSISSKTGFKGDITTYQTTTPLQPGNSGGPLFDFEGNLVGINSAILKSDIAENVSYAIKLSYLKSLIEVLPSKIDLPTKNEILGKPITDQIKLLSNYVVLVKVK